MDADDPRHGQNKGYIAHQKDGEEPCAACKKAAWAFQKRTRLRRIEVGGPLIVTSERARDHIETCDHWGLSPKRVGELARVSDVWRIVKFPERPIHLRTQERILAIKPQPGVNCWPSLGAVRRLQALQALGHEQRPIAERIGLLASHVSELANGKRGKRYIHPRTWQAIADLYEEWSMVPGPSENARLTAARKGWVTPLCWNEGEIDNPDAKPVGVARTGRHGEYDEALIERILAGEWTLVPLTKKAEKIEITRRWLAAGKSKRSLEKATGWQVYRYVERDEESAA